MFIDKFKGFFQQNIPDKIQYEKNEVQEPELELISEEDPYSDEEILDYFDIPSRVYSVYDADRDETTVRLFSGDKQFATKRVKGDHADYYTALYRYQAGLDDEDAVKMTLVKGGRIGLPEKKVQTLSVFDMDAESRAQIARAIIEMQQEDNAPRLLLDGPIRLKHHSLEERGVRFSFESFAYEMKDRKASPYDILRNVKRVRPESFRSSNIESVTVSKGGRNISFTTKDRYFASLNLESGQRVIGTLDYNDLPDLFIDNNGPVISHKPFGRNGTRL